MLLENPFNYLLFQYGYDGKDNIYEYWIENKEELLKYFNRRAYNILNKTNYLEQFELKVRWSSPIGALVKFEIRKFIRQNRAGLIVDFKKFNMKYGKHMLNLDEFYKLYPCDKYKVSDDKIDLRGISLIGENIKDVTFENVDLRYASLDSSIITNVCFTGCKLDYVRFCRSELIDCVFDEYTSIDYIDLSDAYIRAVVKTPLREPIITRIHRCNLIDILMPDDQFWRTYTEVWGSSFPQHCEKKSLCEYIFRLQRVLEQAYSLRNKSVLVRISFIIRQWIKPL